MTGCWSHLLYSFLLIVGIFNGKSLKSWSTVLLNLGFFFHVFCPSQKYDKDLFVRSELLRIWCVEVVAFCVETSCSLIGGHWHFGGISIFRAAVSRVVQVWLNLPSVCIYSSPFHYRAGALKIPSEVFLHVSEMWMNAHSSYCETCRMHSNACSL